MLASRGQFRLASGQVCREDGRLSLIFVDYLRGDRPEVVLSSPGRDFHYRTERSTALR